MPTRPRAPRLALSLQKALAPADRALTPGRVAVRRWIREALRGDAEVTVRFVGEAEGRQLNRDYRGKDYPTNVLTFAYGEGEPLLPDEEDAPISGDLVLCVPVVAREAAEQGKPLDAHYAHLVVHGMLHLQGFDHEDAGEAAEMEALETQILGKLGYADPYA